MRFAVKTAFKGQRYYGWQSQNGGNTVQNNIESVLSKRYGIPIQIVGCCRTDSGVHAKELVFHFDYNENLIDGFLYNINKMLPADIVLTHIGLVDDNFNARFDATSRTYEYKIHASKDPFLESLSYYFPPITKADFTLVNEFIKQLVDMKDFASFCKSGSDVRTTFCKIREANWRIEENNDVYIFHIEADRFLRGMVRLIVGCCINIGLQKIELDSTMELIRKRQIIQHSWSVPAHGLYLNEIKYLTLNKKNS